MRHLSDIMADEQTALFNKTGSFFAFSKSQFLEKRVEGVRYTDCNHGLICPSENVQELQQGLEDIYQRGIETDIKEHGLEAIILRELANHECWYVGSPRECINKLEDYPGVTEDMVMELFRNNWPEEV